MTAARYDLPGALESAALRTVGIATACIVEENLIRSAGGGKRLMWFATTSAADARMLVTGRGAQDPDDARKSQCYHWALSALRIRVWLSEWLARGTPPVLPDIFSDPHCGIPHAIIPRQLLDFAAAAIVCGLQCRPVPVVHNGAPCPSLMRESASEPGLTLEALAAADTALAARHRPGNSIVQPITIGAAPPEEHPFLYARTALYHLAAQADEESAAMGNPIGLFAGRGGRTALVSRGMIDTEDATPKDNLRLFLAGQL